jgi:phage terminase large subunit
MNIKTTKVFEEIENNIDNYRMISCRGGSRSGKTYNICIWIVVYCLRNTGKTITIVRKNYPSLKGSVMRDFIEVLDKFGKYNPNDLHKQEMYYELNGNTIEFLNADDEQKLRGRRRDLLWINESNELHRDEYTQLAIRTTDKIILDYNPSDIDSWIYEEEEKDTCYWFKTTFLDNPFLSQEIIDEIKSLKDKDENLYRVFTLGERGIARSLVFNKYTEETEIPQQAKLLGYGMDFGYTDPNTLISVYQMGEHLYLKELIYESNLTISDLIYRMTQLEMDRTDTIWADSSQPAAIEEIRRSGFNIKPTKKTTIEYGLQLLKRHYIHIVSSPNIVKEFNSYKYKTDKDGKILGVPEDKHNHSLDAVRYCVEMELNPKKINRGKYALI